MKYDITIFDITMAERMMTVLARLTFTALRSALLLGLKGE